MVDTKSTPSWSRSHDWAKSHNWIADTEDMQVLHATHSDAGCDVASAFITSILITVDVDNPGVLTSQELSAAEHIMTDLRQNAEPLGLDDIGKTQFMSMMGQRLLRSAKQRYAPVAKYVEKMADSLEDGFTITPSFASEGGFVLVGTKPIFAAVDTPWGPGIMAAEDTFSVSVAKMAKTLLKQIQPERIQEDEIISLGYDQSADSLVILAYGQSSIGPMSFVRDDAEVIPVPSLEVARYLREYLVPEDSKESKKAAPLNQFSPRLNTSEPQKI
ncbi:MAG: hypothetical protein HY540_01930 [Deltaproteobacteria bacterium]|nr:hypothetical protein [Deltaproteobacteria bacterium]